MANNDFLNQFTNDNYKKQPEKQGKPVPKIETTPVAKPITTPKKETVVVKQEVKKEVPVNDNKLESFREEKRTKVEKAPINPLLIIIPSIVALIIVAILIYIFLFPHIQVQSFVGQTKNDVSAWIKQQGIETSGIILKEEYDFNAPEGTILSQLPETGKVKKDAKMTFVVSKGANPDEYVSVPDLESMNKQEIETWIKENKLSNTKITTAYDNEVENGNVVSVVYGNGIDSSNFTRGSSLKITISKGQKPADQVTVENFVKQPYSSVEDWAEKNKIKLSKTERYSNDIEKGMVISQSEQANKKLNQGDSFSVVVSKGKEIKMINLTNYDETDVIKWMSKEGLNLDNYKIVYRYSNAAKDKVFYQNYEAGRTMNDVEDLVLYVSLGNKISGLETCRTYNELKNIVDKENEKGANIQIEKSEYPTYTNKYETGQILSIDIDTNGDVKIGSTIKVVYAKEKLITLSKSELGQNPTSGEFDTSILIDYLHTNGITFVLNKAENTKPNSSYITLKVFNESENKAIEKTFNSEELVSDDIKVLESVVVTINPIPSEENN